MGRGRSNRLSTSALHLLLVLRRRRRWRMRVSGGLTPALDKVFAANVRGAHHLRFGAALGRTTGRHLALLLRVLLLLSVLLSEWIHRLSLLLLSSLLVLLLLLLLLLLHHVVFSFLRSTLLLLLLSAFVGAPRLSEVWLRQMSLTQLARRQHVCCVVALVLIR